MDRPRGEADESAAVMSNKQIRKLVDRAESEWDRHGAWADWTSWSAVDLCAVVAGTDNVKLQGTILRELRSGE